MAKLNFPGVAAENVKGAKIRMVMGSRHPFLLPSLSDYEACGI